MATQQYPEGAIKQKNFPKEQNYKITEKSLCQTIILEKVVDQNSVISFNTAAIELN